MTDGKPIPETVAEEHELSIRPVTAPSTTELLPPSISDKQEEGEEDGTSADTSFVTPRELKGWYLFGFATQGYT
ncbi:hypothetical protein HK097_006951, partial [Rhizophlyctis rosea]